MLWLCFLLLALPVMLGGQPWLGNWLEFDANLFQRVAQGSLHHKKLYQERTEALCAFMPEENLSVAVELDLAKTQKHSYGFDAIQGSIRYRLLNDLVGDAVSLTAGLKSALSTPSRVKDLSSLQHGVLDTELQLAVGKEFIIHAGNF